MGRSDRSLVRSVADQHCAAAGAAAADDDEEAGSEDIGAAAPQAVPKARPSPRRAAPRTTKEKKIYEEFVDKLNAFGLSMRAKRSESEMVFISSGLP